MAFVLGSRFVSNFTVWSSSELWGRPVSVSFHNAAASCAGHRDRFHAAPPGVSLFNVAGLTAEEIAPWEAGGGGPNALAPESFVFEEEGSAEEFRFHRQAVLDRLQDRLASAFGLWREPRGSPVRGS
jgi:hypothetical protein